MRKEENSYDQNKIEDIIENMNEEKENKIK